MTKQPFCSCLLSLLFVISFAIVVQAQVDIVGMASDLAPQSAELQAVHDELQDKREELAKEAEEVKKDEQKAEEMKAASEDANDPGPIEGPYYLFTGRYSNSADVRGASESEAFGGPAPGGTEYASLAEAHEEAMAHMSRSQYQPSFRIEDSSGNIIESGSYFGRGKSLSPARIANPSAPKADNSAIDQLFAAAAARRTAFETSLGQYNAAKAEYDNKVAEYNRRVDELTMALPEAIRDAGSPIPTADQFNAPEGDFKAEDLATLKAKYTGKTVGDGDSTSFLKEAAGLPDPSEWSKGEKVMGAKLRPGTPIATFNEAGEFVSGKGGHSALYITQNKKGMWVYDQYKNAAGQQRTIAPRFIRIKAASGSPSNNANAYTVIRRGRPFVPPNLSPQRSGSQ